MADMCCILKVSPDGGSAYLAYLDDSETDVHIQQVDPTNFIAVGATMTVKGAKEGTCSYFISSNFISEIYNFAAGGLVAQNDGFALLTNLPVTGVSDAPPGNTPVPVIVRYKSGKQAWKTFLGGPGVHEDFGISFFMHEYYSAQVYAPEVIILFIAGDGARPQWRSCLLGEVWAIWRLLRRYRCFLQLIFS